MKLKYHKIKNTLLEMCTAEAVNFIMEQINNNDHIKVKYNVDAIFCCLNAGLEEYISKKCPIFTNYEDIGKIFKSNYL